MLKCPACKHPKSEVLATRGNARRRRCMACGHRWLTVELHAVDLGTLAADAVRRIPRQEAAK